MKKNGQYVGVDEKYIPEDEKYVDNSTNEELKNLINDGVRSARNYVSDQDNQEKMKRVGRTGIKIAKGVAIGYLVFFGFVLLIIVLTFILVFSNIFRMNNLIDKQFSNTKQQTNISIVEQHEYSGKIF